MDKGMKLKDIIDIIESRAPLRYQDDFDNSGLQVGSPGNEVRRVLVCLDVTEAVMDEAERLGCDLVLSHHPLIFKALRQVGDATYQQRCAVRAVRSDIAVYSAHTSLDNAPHGVNHKIAELLGLERLGWLSPRPDGESGSGLVGELREELPYGEFLESVRAKFGVKALRCSRADALSPIRKVALCGGAGAFLLPQAIASGADCFVCGEFHYHDYFENAGVRLVELGHYQSEQYTQQLLRDILHEAFPTLETVLTGIDTNPIDYM